MKNHLTKTVGSCIGILASLLMLVAYSPVYAQSGPATPQVEGTSPLVGYILAVILVVLLVVGSFVLAPAIVLHYAVRAAIDEERGETQGDSDV